MFDPKDMRPIKLDELSRITFGVSFYLRRGDEFCRVTVDAQELSDPMKMAMFKHDTKQYLQQGLLYVKRNTPFETRTIKPWIV